MKVLLHTFMDCLREDGMREVNHHGRSVAVGDMMAEDKDAGDRGCLRVCWRKISFKIDYLKLSHFAAKTGVPLVIGIFSGLYWSYGLFFYFYPAV